MKPKISYYLSHPIQYFSPLLRLMSEEFDLHVYYFSNASIKGNYDVGFNQKVKWDIPLLEGYNYTFLKNISKRKSLSNRTWDVVNPSAVKTLFQRRPAVVIVNGWSYFSNLLTIFTARVTGRQVWLRAENPLNQELKKSKKKLFVKKFTLKYLLFPFINKFLYIGSESKKFFEYYEVPPDKLLFTPYSVDNEWFKILSKENHSRQLLLKQELKLPADKKIILFTGKYIEKKRPLDIIKAIHLLNDPDIFLVMVGEGQLRNQMEEYITANQIRNVMLTGFVNQSAISTYYSVADIFVMCSGSGETWGLSVNEAMCFSLPIIVSDTCGSSADLVYQGVNGYTFSEGNINELSACIKSLIDDETLRKKMGLASSEIIDNYSNNQIVENIKAAIG